MTADLHTRDTSFRRRFLTMTYIAAGLIGAGMGIAVLFRTKYEWTQVYVPAGARLLAGQDLYPWNTPFRYPPFTAAIAIAFAWMPIWLSNLVFHLISFGAMIVVIRWSWRIAGGGSLPHGQQEFKREIWIAILAILCALRFSFNALSHGQSDLLTALALTGGTLALVRGRSVLAGICWGVGAAIKGPPLLLIGYLFWRGRMLGAIAMLITFLAVSMLPDLIVRPSSGKIWLGVWADQFFQPLLRPQHEMGTWAAGLLDNQSIAGAANRWLTKSARFEDNTILFSQRPDAVGPATLKAIVYGTYALLAIIAAIVMWPPFRSLKRRSENDGSVVRESLIHPYAWEVAIAFCLILLVSPQSSRAHFGILLLPAMCLARVAVISRDRVARISLFTAIALSLISYNLSPIAMVNRVALYLAFVTLTTFSLLIGCCWMRWKERQLTGNH